MNFKNPSKMNDTQAKDCISHKLPKLYKTETGKKFIHHVINSFSRVNTSLVLNQDDPKLITDCITNRILKPVFDHTPSKDELKSLKEFITHDVAIKSKISDKLMGKVEYDYLQEWIKSEIESGNSEIKNIVLYNKNKLNKVIKKSNKPSKFSNKRVKVDHRKTISASDDNYNKLTKLKSVLKNGVH